MVCLNSATIAWKQLYTISTRHGCVPIKLYSQNRWSAWRLWFAKPCTRGFHHVILLCLLKILFIFQAPSWTWVTYKIYFIFDFPKWLVFLSESPLIMILHYSMSSPWLCHKYICCLPDQIKTLLFLFANLVAQKYIPSRIWLLKYHFGAHTEMVQYASYTLLRLSRANVSFLFHDSFPNKCTHSLLCWTNFHGICYLYLIWQLIIQC